MSKGKGCRLGLRARRGVVAEVEERAIEGGGENDWTVISRGRLKVVREVLAKDLGEEVVIELFRLVFLDADAGSVLLLLRRLGFGVLTISLS